MLTRRLATIAAASLLLVFLTNLAQAQRGKPGPPPPPPDPAIAFIAVKSNQWDLMVMNADGSNQRALVSQMGVVNRTPDWSPDGTQLVFDSDIQGPGIYVINVDGSGLRKIPNTPGGGFVDPVWSPAALGDGNHKIAYTHTPPGATARDVFLINLDGMCAVNLTNTPDVDEFFPTWSPDGTRLAAQGFVAGGGRPDLIVYENVQVDDCETAGYGSATNLTASGPFADLGVFVMDWSKDPLQSDKIAVSADTDGGANDIWVVDLSNLGNPTFQNLTNTPDSNDLWPSWSPDNSRIVFSGDGSGPLRRSLFVINADGSGLQLLSSAGKNVVDLREAAWRRNR